MQHTYFTAWPQYETDEIDAVARVLESGKFNYWTGDQGRRFEREFAENITGQNTEWPWQTASWPWS